MKGGERTGAGRPKGTLNPGTRVMNEVAAKVAAGITLKVPFAREPVPIDSDHAWKGLSVPTRERLRERLRDIGREDGRPVYERGSNAGGEAWMAAVEHAGNPLRAAVNVWMAGDRLDEQRFLEVLRLAGMPMETVRVDQILLKSIKKNPIRKPTIRLK